MKNNRKYFYDICLTKHLLYPFEVTPTTSNQQQQLQLLPQQSAANIIRTAPNVLLETQTADTNLAELAWACQQTHT